MFADSLLLIGPTRAMKFMKIQARLAFIQYKAAESNVPIVVSGDIIILNNYPKF